MGELRDKAIRVQPYIDFSPLMTKYGIYDQSCLREFMSNVSINTPKHETVEEWETRKGESYPDDAPVWFKEYVKGDTKEDSFTYFKLSTYKQAIPYGNVENVNRWMECNKNNFTVANHHGKPEIEG